MSALGSKAERQAKPRFQSLDINSLYRTSRGESLEPLAQKSSVPRKHGMQSLGKVPTARRPPANLPSLRAETTTPSGNITDPNSWGGDTKPTTSTPTPVPATSTTSQSSITTQGGPQATWSAVAVGSEAISQPPTYQSPQFQHEFPSLDGNAPNTTQKPGPEVQYGPGPSLRPQTEGSWMQGGSRSGNADAPTAAPATIGASTAVPALQQVPPHLRNLMPPFMYRGSGGGNFVMAQNYVPGTSPATRTTARQQSSQNNTYNESQTSRERRTAAPRRDNEVNESPLQRPIIKEEDLDKMEDIARDVGWAGHDDIDYNQKLAFSDDESSEPSPKERQTPTMIQQSLEIINKNKTTAANRDEETRWNQQRDNRPTQLEFRQNGHLGPRGIIEEEEVWIQRRRQQSEEVAVAVERAKQRREEEERKFLESRQAAAKKLQELEQKLSAKKGTEIKEVSDESLNASETLDFHHLTQIGDGRAFLDRSHGNRDRENNRESVRDNRDNLRGSRDSLREGNREYKEINRERDIRIERSDRVDRDRDRETVSENRSFERESKNRENIRIERDVQSRERDTRLDSSRAQDGPNFSRQFQSNLPPRFQKQQAERNHPGAQSYDRNSRGNSNNNSEKSHSIPFAQQYDPRWVHPPQSYSKSSGATIVRRNQQEDIRGQQNQSEERFVRQASNQSLHRSISDSSQRKLSTSSDDKNSINTQPEAILKMDTSPLSEVTDFSGSWADEPFENEKLFEPNLEEIKTQETEEVETETEKVEVIPDPVKEIIITKALETNMENSSESTVTVIPVAELNIVTQQNEKHENVKVTEKTDKDIVNEDIRIHKKSSPRGRIDHNRGSSRGAYAVFRGGSNNTNWGRRGAPRLGMPRSNSSHSGVEYTWSETDGSTEELDDDRKNNKASKSRREDASIRRSDSNTQKTQREGFAPRGEPSRRGRGGFRARGATLGKRMDGYGPPSSKSPFGGDEKPKEINTDGLTPDDRTKLKQQALSAGIIGSTRGSTKVSAPPRLRSTGRSKQSGKCVQSDEAWETTSEHSDSQEKGNKNGRTNQAKCLKSISQKGSTERKPLSTSSTPTKNNSKSDPPPKTTVDQQNLVKKDALEGIDLNNFASVVVVDEQPEENLNATNTSDIDGFQEVRSKKTAKEFRKDEPQFPQPARQGVLRHEKDKKERPLSKNSVKTSISTNKTNTTPAVVVAPLVVKPQLERPRQNSKLPPRFAKQKENIRMQRAQAQEMNVLAPMPPVNAWDKPITASLRSTLESDTGINVTLEGNDGTVLLTEGSPSGNSSQRSTPGGHIEKAPVSKTSDVKSVLDGTSPPVNTIIFENTNYKSGPPGVKRLEKRDAELFKNASLDMMENVNRDSALASLPLSFPKNETDYEKDMKLAFTFDSELSQLTDDKGSKGLGLSRSMSSSVQSTISPSTAELNLKIQSVKKVWESVPVMPTVLEHNSNDENQHNLNSSHSLATHNHNMTSQHQINTSQHNLKHSPMNQSHANQMSVSQHNLTQAHNLSTQHALTLTSQHNLSQSHNLSPANSYAGNFGGDPNLEHFSKDGPDGEGGYSPSPQHVVSGGHYNQHAQQNVLNKHGEVLGNTNVCKVKPTQQTMHPSGIGGSIGTGGQGSQQGLGLSPPPALQTNALQAPPPYYQANQFGGMSAIPSPPAMLFNSSQAMLGSNQIPSQQGLYGTFQLEQGRSGFSQFPGPYGGGSAQYNYMQTPPSMPATPDMYQNLTSQYRMGAAPFGQSQQINNPSTVLISSTSNSLMSASVKPSSQQIGAIGSKTGSVGQHYNQPYVGVAFAPGPQGPIQNNSYYTGGSQGVGGSQGGFYQQGGSQGFSLPANMFNNNQPPPQAPVQSFGSQFLSSPLQLAAAAMQQYRAPQSAYLKGQSSNHLPDSCTRQLKSPIGEPLGPLKQAPPQPSPPQHKGYPTSVLQQGSGGRPGSLSRGSGGPPRYPAPIQRPTGYPTSANGGISNRGQRPHHGGHAHTQQGPVKHYYSRGSQGSSGNSEQPGKSVEKNDGTQVNNNQTDNNKDESNNE